MGDSAVFKLEVENELRVVVGDQPHNVGVELLDGLAEIFGTEMEKNKVYSFPQFSSIAVFTWHGCSIKVIGNPSESYIVTDTHIILHVILHARLEEMRINAEKTNRQGPVTLIVGPNDSGKSTLGRLLLNYAARMGRRPLLIDIDVGQNSLSIPGTMNVLTVEKPADIVDGFDQNSVGVYQFGYISPGQHIALYSLLLQKVGQTLKSHLRNASPIARSSGVVINSCGWTRGYGYNAITLAAMTFEIDTLVVLEEERLYLELKRDMPACVEVVYFPKMGGVFSRSRPVRSHYREKRVKEYFYGSTTPLRPFTFDIMFSDVQIFRAGMKHEVQDVDSLSLNDICLISVPIGPHLLRKVLALSSAENVSEEIVLSNIIGFVCVMSIDTTRDALKILCPQPGPLPKKILLMGDIGMNTST